MKLDLHVHARPYTKAALCTPHDVLEQAKKVGLDGICFLTQNQIDSRRAFQDTKTVFKGFDLVLFSGAEIETTRGTVLVYGINLENDVTFDRPVEICSLINWVHDQGGAIVLPHMLRDVVDAEPYLDGIHDWWIRGCDALELTFSTDRQDDIPVTMIANRLETQIIKGSNAHYHKMIGKKTHQGPWYTEIDRTIANDAELVKWLRRG